MEPIQLQADGAEDGGGIGHRQHQSAPEAPHQHFYHGHQLIANLAFFNEAAGHDEGGNGQ